MKTIARRNKKASSTLRDVALSAIEKFYGLGLISESEYKVQKNIWR